jgi:hypothetical protein
VTFEYIRSSGTAYFLKLSYGLGLDVGSKTDFWLISGKYILGSETDIKFGTIKECGFLTQKIVTHDACVR